MICTIGGKSQVVVETSAKVSDLVQIHVNINKNQEGKLAGFSIQICSESGNHSREKAEAMRTTFLSKYPKIRARVTFREPNFRVRVGDFRTRAEARGFLQKIQMDFPQAFVVKDEVRYPVNITELAD
jgi:hypothetical protein